MSCFGCENKNVVPFTRFKSKKIMAKKHGKNSKKTTRRATFAIWRLFADLNNPKRALSKINLTIDGGKHIFAMILNQEIFE